MTLSDIIRQVQDLPIGQKLTVLEIISRSIREELVQEEQTSSSEDKSLQNIDELTKSISAIEIVNEKPTIPPYKGMPAALLLGIAAPKDKLPPDDTEVKEMITDYLSSH